MGNQFFHDYYADPDGTPAERKIRAAKIEDRLDAMDKLTGVDKTDKSAAAKPHWGESREAYSDRIAARLIWMLAPGIEQPDANLARAEKSFNSLTWPPRFNSTARKIQLIRRISICLHPSISQLSPPISSKKPINYTHTSDGFDIHSLGPWGNADPKELDIASTSSSSVELPPNSNADSGYPMYDQFLTIAHNHDLFTALDHLHSSGTPTQVATLYDQLLRDAYWKHKNLPLATTLATAGIHFCLTHAHHAHLTPDPSLATSLKSSAKALAYNLASFTWPGWDEPGISPTPADIALGHEAAKLNLRLALELQKPPDKIRNAHWLLGAHLLAAPTPDHLQHALIQFQRALPPDPSNPTAPPDPDHPLYQGYILLTQLLLQHPTAEQQWTTHLDTLQSTPNEANQFALTQLTTARRIFQPAP